MEPSSNFIENYFRKCIARWGSIFKSIKVNQSVFLSGVLGLFTVFLYFFSTYFPMLYLLAAFLLFFKWVFFELSFILMQKEGAESISSEVSMINYTLFEVTDILLWIAIILSDTHYYVIGIFLLAVYCLMYFFDGMSVKSEKSSNWQNYLSSPLRAIYLLPVSLLQCFFQEIHWGVDVIYIFFCLIVLTGVALTINYVYQLFFSYEARSHR